MASRALRQIGEALHADHSFLYLWDQATESLRAAAAEGLTVCSQEALGVEWNDSRPDLDDWVQVWRDGLHGDDVAQRVLDAVTSLGRTERALRAGPSDPPSSA